MSSIQTSEFSRIPGSFLVKRYNAAIQRNLYGNIVIDPEIHHGEPCMAGRRIPVSMILKSMNDGMTMDEIISSYPQLTREAVQAVWDYRRDLVFRKLLGIRDKAGRGGKSKKSAVEILSDMRR